MSDFSECSLLQECLRREFEEARALKLLVLRKRLLVLRKIQMPVVVGASHFGFRETPERPECFDEHVRCDAAVCGLAV